MPTATVWREDWASGNLQLCLSLFVNEVEIESIRKILVRSADTGHSN